MAEYRRPDRPAEKPDEKDGERLQHTDDRVGLREEELPDETRCKPLGVKTRPVTWP